MRLAPSLTALTLLACAGGPAPAPSRPAPLSAAPAPSSVQPPPALNEPVGVAAARLSGPASGLTAACQDAMARTRTGIEAVKTSLPPRDTVATLTAYDDALAAAGDLASQAAVARQASPDAGMRKAGEECGRQIQALLTGISQDRTLYQVLSGLDLSGQDRATRWWMERELRDFRRAGVDRDEATRERVRALNDDIVAIGQEFDRNIREGTRTVAFAPAELAGLPDDFRKAHPPGADGRISLTTDYPDYKPFMAYSRSGKAREALWRAYNTRAPANAEVLTRLLARRHELATALGYAHWADYITEDKMIRSGKAASDFIERISTAARPRSEVELSILLARKRKDDRGATRFEAWDYSYESNRVKAEQYRFDAKTARPYFEATRVLDGVMGVTGKLLDISYRPVQGATVWHPEVRVYDVIGGPSFEERAGQAVGRVYLDLHPRENKYKHAAQYTVINGQRGHRLPEGALLCNFPRSGGLMEYDDVQTLFHEFGHLVHHVLGGHTRWAANSGTSTERDFVEAPSQMLEEWTRDLGVLQGFARHVKTGKPIPTSLVRKLRAAEEFGKGIDVRQQMFYAATSLHLHDRDPKGMEPTAFVADLQSRYGAFPFVPGSTFYTAFGHLNGYSAVYYTYMWSLVIAKDLFTAFESTGVFDRESGARYRRRILEPGGGKPAAELVTDFLGRPYDFAAYEAWLNRGTLPGPRRESGPARGPENRPAALH